MNNNPFAIQEESVEAIFGAEPTETQTPEQNDKSDFEQERDTSGEQEQTNTPNATSNDKRARVNNIQDIKKALNQKYFEREKEVEALLTAILAKQHALFIGEAGTGKSQLSAELNNIIDGSDYFQWLLNQFSTPEELFGVLSLKELEQGVYKRNTQGKLPESHFAFLDEIFKANSAILNSLLTLINERLFYNNGKPIQTPLMSIVGSSNEYPEEGEGLDALFDRFLLRQEVEYIQEDQSFAQMLEGGNDQITIPTMTLEDLKEAQTEVDSIEMPNNVIQTLVDIRNELKDEGIRPSDRRFKQSLSLVKAQAYMDGRQKATDSDLEILKYALWVNPEQQDACKSIVEEYAQDKNLQEFNKSKVEFEQVKDALMQKEDELSGDEKSEMVQRLGTIRKEVQNLNYDPDEIEQFSQELYDFHEYYVRKVMEVGF